MLNTEDGMIVIPLALHKERYKRTSKLMKMRIEKTRDCWVSGLPDGF